MRRRPVVALAGALFLFITAASAWSAVGRPPVRVAEASAAEDAKQEYLAQSAREVTALEVHVARLTEITPAEGGANAVFHAARKNFNDKLAALRTKLAALRQAPADYAESSMREADAALENLRTAYSTLVDAAP